MRPFSTIGWFMCQAIGTMQLDRDASPLGLVVRAWAADVEPKLAGGNHVRVDHASGAIHVSDTPWPEEHIAQSKLSEAAEKIAQCPMCLKSTPKSEIDGSYPYECCNQCYWELPG